MSTELVVVHSETDTMAASQPLSHYVAQSVEQYFTHLGDTPPSNLYDLMLEEIEIPLLQMVMKYAKGNQCKASDWLTISRGTLRKKLKQYGLD